MHSVHSSTLFAWSTELLPLPLCPWVGWRPQRCPGPSRPPQEPPELPPITGHDVTGLCPKPADVCPSAGSRARGGAGEEDQEPFVPPHPSHLQRPCQASPRLAHGGPEGKSTNTPVEAVAVRRRVGIFSKGHGGGASAIPNQIMHFPYSSSSKLSMMMDFGFRMSVCVSLQVNYVKSVWHLTHLILFPPLRWHVFIHFIPGTTEGTLKTREYDEKMRFGGRTLPFL